MKDAFKSTGPVFVALAVGAAALVATEVVLIFLVRRLGLAWHGEIFGNEPFNWKDSMVWFVSYACFLAGFFSTIAYFKRRLRAKQRRGSDEVRM